MAGTVVSTTPRPTYGGRTLSSRERQLEARFRTTYIPNFQATSPSYAAVGSPHVISSQAKTASALGRQGASMLATAGAGAALNYVAPTMMASLGASLGMTATGAASPALAAAYGLGPGASAALGAGFGGGGGVAMSGLGSLMSGMAAAAPYIAVALIVAGLVMGMGAKSDRNIQLSGYSLPANAPDVLKRLGINREPVTIQRYRYFQAEYDQATAPLHRAYALTQKRLGSLSRIFPGMRTVSSQLDEARAAALGGSGSQGEAFSKLQGYADGLYKAEGFIEELFQDPMAQSYMGRKTKMPFEEFEKGFKFSTDVWIMNNLSIPGQERARTEAVYKSKQRLQKVQGKASVINRVNRPTQLSTLTQSFMDNYYTPIYGRGRGGGGSSIKGYRAVRPPGTGGGRSQYGKSFNPGGKNYKTLQVSEYEAMFNKAQTTAMKQITNPFDVELARMRDFTASEPQFGSYTQFRPFQPNWTPGMPQLGLSADAPGPDLDSLKTVLNVQDGQFAGMSGGSGYPLTRFGMGTVPRMSQGKMARQA